MEFYKMNEYQSEKNRILNEISEKSIMILATSKNNIVSARSMSVIFYKGKIYFQTGKLMEKYDNIINNKNIALCESNIQIQGIARDIGPWNLNEEILPKYKEKHNISYNLYGEMKSQTVIEVTIKKIKKWDYLNGKPYIYEIDFDKETFENTKYDMNN
jgi:uncharacterized pyridoxamine 5'-phosphate oxidase family protein